MANLINDTDAARNWVEETIQRHSDGVFGKLASAVIWSDARDANGRPLVDVDPNALVTEIAESPMVLLHNHDPGRPIGEVLDAASFSDPEGKQFVAAILGFYTGGNVMNFRDCGINAEEPVSSAALLPPFPENCWIEIGVDSRDIKDGWLEQLTNDAPLPVVRRPLSHNSAESMQELIRVGLIYLALVWNPFVTSIASEAGRRTYASVHAWVRKLIEGLAERHNPIIDLHTFQGDCQVSFLLRGKDVEVHYKAHDSLATAAAQGAVLIANLKARSCPARQLVYEFDKEILRWYPSFAILTDGRIVTDSLTLIAFEQLPSGLSLGLVARALDERR